MTSIKFGRGITPEDLLDLIEEDGLEPCCQNGRSQNQFTKRINQKNRPSEDSTDPTRTDAAKEAAEERRYEKPHTTQRHNDRKELQNLQDHGVDITDSLEFKDRRPRR